MRSLGIKQKDHPMDYIIAIDKNNTLGGVSPSFSHLDSTNPLIVLNTTITLYTEYFSLRLIATKFKIINFPTSYRWRLSWEVERDARDSDEEKRKMLTDLNQVMTKKTKLLSLWRVRRATLPILDRHLLVYPNCDLIVVTSWQHNTLLHNLNYINIPFCHTHHMTSLGTYFF